MKLERLTIHNMASIADAEIDFNSGPLAEGGVFLIAGKTGAGKTTILDAICLALYARTPRFESSRIDGRTADDASGAKDALKVNDARQIMRRNTGDARCELVFEGNNRRRYRATWSVSRARKKPGGAIQSKKWSLEDLDGGTVFAKDKEIEEEIGKAVGLDYSQFCRTTMLAQGEFTRFLNSKDSEKSSILSKITGTEIYSRIGKAIFERTRERRLVLEQAEERMKGITLLTEEETAARQNRVDELTAESRGLSKEFERANALLENLKGLLSTREELRRLDESDRMYAHRFTLLREESKSLGKDIESAQEKILQLEKEVDRERESGRTLAYEYEQAILERLRTVRANRTTIEEEEKKISENQTAVRDTFEPRRLEEEKALTEAREALRSEENDVEEERRAVDALGLAGMREEKETLVKGKGEIELAVNSLTQYEENRARLQKERDELQEMRDRLADEEKNLRAMDDDLAAARDARDAAKKEYDRQFADQEEVASRIRAALQTGDICPVCRRRIEDALPTDEEIRQLVAVFKKRLDEAQARFDTIDSGHRRLDAEIKANRQSVDSRQKKLDADHTESDQMSRAKEALTRTGLEMPDSPDEELIASLKARLADMLAENGMQTDSLAGRLGEAEKRETALKKREKGIKKLRDNVDKKKEELEGTEKKIKACNDAITLSRTIIERCGTTISACLEEVCAKTGNGQWLHDPGKETAGFEDELAEKARVYKETSGCLDSRRKLLADLLKEQEEVDTILSDIEETYGDRQMVPETGVPGDVVPESGGSLPARAAALRSDITASANLRAKLDAEELRLIGALQAEAGDTADTDDSTETSGFTAVDSLPLPEQIAESETHRQRLVERIAGLNQERGALEQELKQNGEKCAQANELRKEIEMRKLEFSKWSRLNEAFGDSEGNRFQTIAQSYVLAGLIHSANHYMRTLTSRYTLSVPPGTFIIMVEDEWQGGTRRAASTISGGESFLVSLALALALSDIGGDISVDTLFIDEGFGTLSDEELRSAVDTLRNLSTRSGRRVGIISHVAELRESIPVQVLVDRVGGGRSEITVREMMG